MHAMFVENIIMFIPFGVLLPILFENLETDGYVCWQDLFALVSIEISAAYYSNQDFYNWIDVMTNTTGTAVGYWFDMRCIGKWTSKSMNNEYVLQFA